MQIQGMKKLEGNYVRNWLGYQRLGDAMTGDQVDPTEQRTTCHQYWAARFTTGPQYLSR